MKKIFIGVDVSKLKLDFCNFQDEKYCNETIVPNHMHAIRKHLQDVVNENPTEGILVCAEYTGQYIYPLCCACDDLGIDLWLENPVQIKYRSGMQRGKNDKLDARKIAAYAQRFEDQAFLFSLPEKSICTLKHLVSELDMLVCDKAKYKGQLTDQKDFMDGQLYKNKHKRLSQLIQNLNETIKQIETEIQSIIDNDKTLSRQHQLLCSVDGIGEKTSIKMILETNAFKDFKDPRKFCCHAGVAPFSYTSGSSIRSKRKVSKRADKSIKALLHMAALSASKTKGDLGQYYIRKVMEGKNKMTVLNAIRAKLVLRMFAVIRNDNFYVQNYINPLSFS
jgi:transposase